MMKRLFIWVSLAVFLSVCGVSPVGQYLNFGVAHAQDAEQAPDYDGWVKVAQRAESALADRRASDTAFEGLRTELVTWRAIFLGAQDINQARIATLQNQISALGPTPEETGVEPAELSMRRTDLNEQLVILSAPRIRAIEAYSHADGLIRELDTIIRDRQSEQLFELTQSPLNPVLWPDAFRKFTGTLTSAKSEFLSAWNTPAQQISLREGLPITLLYLLVAFVLLLRGRGWMVNLTQRARNSASGASAGVRGFAASLGQVVLPVVGLYAFVQALVSTGMLGFRGQLIVDGLIPVGVAFFVARWLVLRLLPLPPVRVGFLQLPEQSVLQVRRLGGALALVWGGNRLISELADFESYSEATRVVLLFPFVAVAGFLLFRFGQVLHRSVNEAEPDSGQDHDTQDAPAADWSFRTRSTGLFGRALTVVGVAGPVVAAVGYYSAASAVVFPMVLTLGLLALLIVMAGVLRDIYALLTSSDDAAAREALIPVLVSFALVMVSVPVFALIWGARVSELTEVWTRFLEGITLGDVQISPTDFLIFAVIFVLGYMVTRLLQSTLKNSVLPKTSIDPGGQTAIVSGLGYVGLFVAALVAITMAGIDLSSLAIVAGALSVGIGFGLQNIVSNFVSGIILLIERPIAEGDWIEAGGHSGTVREISVRSTRIETFNRTDVIIPNSDLISGAVTNYTRGNLIGRAVISVGVAYGSDTHQVERILEEIAAAHPMVLLDPGPSVHLIEFGADSLDFQIRAVLRDVNFILRVTSDINHEIVRRFGEENIEIPFAQRDVWLRNPETLTANKDT